MTEPKRRVLVLCAHPQADRSEAGQALVFEAARMEGVTVADLYAEYPDMGIDIDAEQARLAAHDVVVFLFPVFWYSTPAMLKEWQDLVLEYGWAYGEGGDKLSGKIFFCAATAGGPESAYTESGQNHFSLPELMRPLEATAAMCGMRWLPPFALFAARRALDDGRLDTHRDAWVRLLEGLRDDTLDLDAAGAAHLLNHLIAGEA